MSEVIASFRSWRAGSQVFALLMFLCVVLHTMWSVRACNCYASCPLVLVCHQYDVCKNYVGSVYVAGYGGLSKSCELCPVSFLVVGEGPSVLL